MNGTVFKECVHHGLTSHRVGKEGRIRCRKCSVEAVNKRRRKMKKILIDDAGGKCVVCGYDRYQGALGFHHKNPEEKDFSISQRVTKSLDRLKKEAEKCFLVCCRCHAEIHGGLIELKD